MHGRRTKKLTLPLLHPLLAATPGLLTLYRIIDPSCPRLRYRAGGLPRTLHPITHLLTIIIKGDPLPCILLVQVLIVYQRKMRTGSAQSVGISLCLVPALIAPLWAHPLIRIFLIILGPLTFTKTIPVPDPLSRLIQHGPRKCPGLRNTRDLRNNRKSFQDSQSPPVLNIQGRQSPLVMNIQDRQSPLVMNIQDRQSPPGQDHQTPQGPNFQDPPMHLTSPLEMRDARTNSKTRVEERKREEEEEEPLGRVLPP